MTRTAVLLVDCPDAKGIVASISSFLYSHGANILSSDQHQDNEVGLFFMRVEFDLSDFTLNLRDFARAFRPVADRFPDALACRGHSHAPSRRYFCLTISALPGRPAAPAPNRRVARPNRAYH